MVTTPRRSLRCGVVLDKGDVYLRELLSLHCSAEKIFLRADAFIEAMIERIVRDEQNVTPQRGDPVLLSCRTPGQSNLSCCREGDIPAWYDQIRMPNAEGYPHAFLEAQGMRLEFRCMEPAQ